MFLILLVIFFFQTEKLLLLLQKYIENSFIAIKRKLKRQFIKFTFNSSV